MNTTNHTLLKPAKIVPQEVECFDPEGTSFGFLNEYEFNDLRIKVKNANVTGYHAIFDGKKIDIQSNGEVHNWPVGFFDLFDSQLNTILDIWNGE